MISLHSIMIPSVWQTSVLGRSSVLPEAKVKVRLNTQSPSAASKEAIPSARLNANQAKAHEEISKTGGAIAGEGKPNFPGGTKIPPVDVNIITGPDF